MTENKYFVTDCVKLKDGSVGRIERIEKSNGEKKGIIYYVNNEWCFEDDIVDKLIVNDTPMNYMNKIKNIKEQMSLDIYNLIVKHGSKNVSKRNGLIKYSISLKSRLLGDCIIRNVEGNKIHIIKAEIIDKDGWNKGYLNFYDTDKQLYSVETDLTTVDVLDIYPHLFCKLSNKI